MVPMFVPTHPRIRELERLGDQIAELSAHLDAATVTRVATLETEARLLEVGRAGTAAHVERIVRGWRHVDRTHGLAIGPRTGLPHWCGERLDLGWAIDVLHPAANPAAYRRASG